MARPSDLQRQTCLANPAGPGERERTTREQELADLGNLPLASNKASEANGQARGFLARSTYRADWPSPLWKRSREPSSVGGRQLQGPGQQRDRIAAGFE